MASTLTNTGVVVWNVSSDKFSYSQLANNWQRFDAHDHTTGKGVQIPTAGLQDSSVTTAKLAANAVSGVKIVNGAVDTTKLATSVTTLLPSTGQKSAFVGTTGTPGSANRYVTETDPRIHPIAGSVFGTGSITTTNSNQAVPGLSIALPQIFVGDLVFVTVALHMTAAGNSLTAELLLNGSVQSGTLVLGDGNGSNQDHIISRQFLLTPGALAAGATLSARARATSAAGGVTGTNSSIIYRVERA